MNLEDLKLLTAVAAAGSFSAAARDLEVPKATLSRRIAGFERSLGVPLLHRTTRRLALSEAGQRLIGRAAPLLEELGALGEEIQSYQRAPVGRLRLQVPAELIPDELTRVLCSFAAQHPEIDSTCSYYAGPEPADPRDFDVTVVGYEWRLPASDWIAVPFLSLRQGVFAAPAVAPVGQLEPAALAELAAVLAPGETLWQFRDGADLQSVPMAGRLKLDSPAMRLRAAELGAGLVKAPILHADEALRAGRLVALDLTRMPAALTVALLYRSRTLPLRVRLFVEHLQSNLVPSARTG